ncbi:MAG TPA: 50S ribosomal protein L6 [Patescibacteria group bacterium]|uniref:Large ribosomal subunit protein uL6 n=1 Tax=uncultured Berkelbacteria bacterium Rifle_16ft_4_minimus_38443 TaxID=1665092 RepID=A0A0H4TB14_9BACT|nr:LSU ribosomal protein L6P [uncultured Berkelbacteria bacterium Rifle_16ft_4_minimus_38443]HLC38632.1 50S ribosomal protein L6 [Patescibacteria group bacterium]
MSKLGRRIITIPEGVQVTVGDQKVKVSGPKGNLDFKMKLACEIKIENNLLQIIPKNQDTRSKRLWGLTRAQIKNMVVGVSEGYQKTLELIGVGFRAKTEDARHLVLSLGFSHPVEFEAPEGIELVVEKNKIKISGIDKQKVGQTAAIIRSIKKPEPYKGKGIKYSDEIIRRKAGKAVAKIEGGKE